MKLHISTSQSFYSIVTSEIEAFLEVEKIDMSESSINRITDLFFQTIGIKKYTSPEELMEDIKNYIKIPIIIAKECEKVNITQKNHLIIKSIDNMQTTIKKYISLPPIFTAP
jgi:hypothetical protein